MLMARGRPWSVELSTPLGWFAVSVSGSMLEARRLRGEDER